MVGRTKLARAIILDTGEHWLWSADELLWFNTMLLCIRTSSTVRINRETFLTHDLGLHQISSCQSQPLGTDYSVQPAPLSYIVALHMQAPWNTSPRQAKTSIYCLSWPTAPSNLVTPGSPRVRNNNDGRLQSVDPLKHHFGPAAFVLL